MEKFEITSGNTYWLCSIEYKTGSGRFTHEIPPTQVEVTLKNGTLSLFVPKKTSQSFWIRENRSWTTTLSIDPKNSWYYMDFLRETKEDCKELYNSKIERFLEENKLYRDKVTNYLVSKKF